VVFFCFLPFLFLKVDPKEVKCLLQKISKYIKIKPATLQRVIIMIVIMDKRFHTRWRILKGDLVCRVLGEARSNKLFSISLSTKNTVAFVCVCDRYECSNN